jgi:cell division protein FtsL
MLRFLNILAVVALMGSAAYAYTIKYQTAYRAEQIAKTKIEIRAERNAVAVLRAEWTYLTRPERIQQLADRYLDLRPLDIGQIATAQSLPDRAAHGEPIKPKIDDLAVGSIGAPQPKTDSASATPKGTRRKP